MKRTGLWDFKASEGYATFKNHSHKGISGDLMPSYFPMHPVKAAFLRSLSFLINLKEPAHKSH